MALNDESVGCIFLATIITIITLTIKGCGFEIFLYILLSIIAVFLIYRLATAGKRKRARLEKQEEAERFKEQQLKEFEEKKNKYHAERQNYIDKYGEPDKEIIINDLDISQEIMAFGKVHRILIMGNDITFGEVLSCTYNDNPYVKKGKLTYESKTETNTGSMLGRAVVGGVLAGGAGALIGGSTASKDTQTIANQEDDITIHDYTVIVNINSLSNPIIRIPLGRDGKTVNEIIGLLNVVINNK